MARTFKIAFPLPGRRSSNSPSATPGTQLSESHEVHDVSPLHYPSLKVLEVLGAVTPDSVISAKKPTRKHRRNLRKLPSFMSVTLADLEENESTKAEEGFPFPGMQTPGMLSANSNSQPLRRPSHAISRHGSSPLLGEYPAKGSTVDNTTPRPQLGNTLSARNASSLSDLRSHYDKVKSPLAMTQQTSDLATADMALRSREPPMTRSLTTNPVPERIHSRNQSGTSKTSNGSNISARTKIAGNPRRRPSVNDHPTLYPNAPKAFAHAVSPPPALINSSLPRTMQAGQTPLTFGRSRWWDRRKPKISPPIEVPEKFDHVPFEDSISSAKVNVKKPKKGISNWFEALETDESSLSNDAESELGKYQAQDEAMLGLEVPEERVMIHDLMAPDAHQPTPAISARKSSFSNKNKRNGQPDRKLSFKLETSGSQFQHIRELSQSKPFRRTSMIKSAPGSPTGRNSLVMSRPRDIRMRDVDLQIQSVLNLSSSEDEEETEAENSAAESHRRHHIRASIERADYGDEILLGNALRVQRLKPTSIVDRLSDGSSYRRSQINPTVQSLTQFPSRPQLTQRSSSIRWQTLLDAKAGGSISQSQDISTTTADASESTFDSAGGSSVNGNTPPSSHSPPEIRLGVSNKRSSTTTPLRRGSKLMSVTSEEETLLEVMRKKRASIRATDFQKGFNSAMQLQIEDYISRPKTSGVDGRNSRSSIYGAGSSRGSISPPLLGPTVYRPPAGSGGYHYQFQQQQQQKNPAQIEHVYKASLGATLGLSASTDNLTLEDAYPFPEVPSEPIPLNITRSPVMNSEISPSLTFSSSDVMPNTPSIRDSLRTPPLLGMNHRSLVSASGPGRGVRSFSPPRDSSKTEDSGGGGQCGHERRKTGSSSVVMLDGVESYAAKLDEENEISGWAVESGIDHW